ncbi:cytosine/adenosine deaminase-related metal-dependent hydrolase [Virgibacillus natechei]|uniref:Cytosine/adenosine deaminase-related metal-dependent hydrolase n=1 Tax=Virgibacillus natechei TaxID=1216297 RepID=A0ABS4IG80_9BACI|nr:cytosine/adenosine deaminase-related metal-dependent hydrolase [Virgibacillus natechei]
MLQSLIYSPLSMVFLSKVKDVDTVLVAGKFIKQHGKLIDVFGYRTPVKFHTISAT